MVFYLVWFRPYRCHMHINSWQPSYCPVNKLLSTLSIYIGHDSTGPAIHIMIGIIENQCSVWIKNTILQKHLGYHQKTFLSLQAFINDTYLQHPGIKNKIHIKQIYGVGQNEYLNLNCTDQAFADLFVRQIKLSWPGPIRKYHAL